MIRRALWIGGTTLMMAACGPMPGYVAPSDRSAPDKSTSGVEYSAPDDETADKDDDDFRVERRRVTRTTPRTVARDRATADDPGPTAAPAPTATPSPAPTAAPEPSPVPTPAPAPTTSDEKLQVVPLGRSDTYYLIDRSRGLCFFIHKETSAAIDCATIPEGRDIAAPQPPAAAPAPTPAPPAKPDEGVRRRYVEPAPEPPPAAPARRATPAPAPTADPSAPTADELNRFESAYVEIACDRRQGSFTPPHARVEEAGLSQDRYNAIETWLTSDERAWRLLVNRAYRECDQRGR